ncbi:MAG TPA: hypothetical protein VF077_13130 [Nitrospiraceae bacterium]
MKISYWTYHGIKPDGTLDGAPGQVCVTPKMDTSGNHHAQTRSTIESGLWMSVSTGRLEDGAMHGITLFFDDEQEMRDFEASGEFSTPITDDPKYLAFVQELAMQCSCTPASDRPCPGLLAGGICDDMHMGGDDMGMDD